MRRNNYSRIGALLTTIAVSVTAYADITVKLNPSIQKSDFEVEYGYISDMTKSREERPEPTREKLSFKKGKAVIKTLSEGNAQYVIPTGEREYLMIYTQPKENLTVNIDGISPLSYSITGSQLMSDIAKLDTESAKLLKQYRDLMASGNATDSEIEKISKSYDKIFKDYLATNSDAAAVPYAIMHLEGEDFMNSYNSMSAKAKESPIALLLEPQKEYVEKRLAAELHAKELQNGQVTAPDFTFNDQHGKPVSLSDFRGKWVIIDFWGTWCPWCIKGFPSLKKAYAEKKEKLEVIGVDCRDKYETWLAGIVKYDLPWVNVYNPDQKGGKVLEEYAVEGFPTKVIVTPEGKIANITAGDDPAFYSILDELMSK